MVDGGHFESIPAVGLFLSTNLTPASYLGQFYSRPWTLSRRLCVCQLEIAEAACGILALQMLHNNSVINSQKERIKKMSVCTFSKIEKDSKRSLFNCRRKESRIKLRSSENRYSDLIFNTFTIVRCIWVSFDKYYLSYIWMSMNTWILASSSHDAIVIHHSYLDTIHFLPFFHSDNLP